MSEHCTVVELPNVVHIVYSPSYYGDVTYRGTFNNKAGAEALVQCLGHGAYSIQVEVPNG